MAFALWHLDSIAGCISARGNRDYRVQQKVARPDLPATDHRNHTFRFRLRRRTIRLAAPKFTVSDIQHQDHRNVRCSATFNSTQLVDSVSKVRHWTIAATGALVVTS